MTQLFASSRKPVVGMLHVPALPGSPHNRLDLTAITDWVLRDAESLVAGGVDAMILENFGDIPFFPDVVPPHTVAFLSVLAREVRRLQDVPLGINVLRNDGVSALGVATAAGAEFIRVNVFTGARLTDQGVIEGRAHRLLRLRKFLGCDVRIFADVNVKHSAPLAPRDLADEVEETILRGSADAVIVTGSATGKQTSLDDLKTARNAAHGVPVLAGSGADAATIASVLTHADGVIAGTALKTDSLTTNPVDRVRVHAFMSAARQL
jgi:membrane complex biogenesis BtpA family protein